MAFSRAIESGKVISNIKYETSIAISKIMEDYFTKKDIKYI